MSKTRIDRIRDDIKLANERRPNVSLIGNADKLSKLQDKLINEDLKWALQRICDIKRLIYTEVGIGGNDCRPLPGIETWMKEMGT